MSLQPQESLIAEESVSGKKVRTSGLVDFSSEGAGYLENGLQGERRLSTANR